jgi:hypothetical protein
LTGDTDPIRPHLAGPNRAGLVAHMRNRGWGSISGAHGAGVAAAANPVSRRCGEAGRRVGQDHGEASHRFWAAERREAHRSLLATAMESGRRGVSARGHRSRRGGQRSGQQALGWRWEARGGGGWSGGWPTAAGIGEAPGSVGAKAVGLRVGHGPMAATTRRS